MPAAQWVFRADPLEQGLKQTWQSPTLSTSDWLPIRVPSFWGENEGVGNIQGYGWYRTTLPIRERCLVDWMPDLPYRMSMSVETEELVRICELLPPAKRTEVTDFARFLAARQDDDRWETLLNHPAPRPQLDAFLRESAAEGESPLDPSRL